MRKFFNTAGPCDPQRHYMLPAADRIPGAREYIAEGQYFVVHAPRQTGKTTTLGALAKELTAEGEYVALRFSCEVAGPFEDDVSTVEEAVLQKIYTAAQTAGLGSEFMPPLPWPQAKPGTLLGETLRLWTMQCPKPLVLFFDEIDALTGRGLVSVLRQLRDGYTAGHDGFIYSVVLCGMRNVRDYKAAAGGDPSRLRSASPFNISVASVRLGDFTREEVGQLYGQHTSATGQEFTVPAVDLAHYNSQGQPWLVNALAREVVRQMRVTGPIGEDHIDEASERLIRARATHLDSLVDKLYEPRIQRVIEPLIAGQTPVVDATYHDDLSYAIDLGLISRETLVRVANPIYQEVIIRALGEGMETVIPVEPARFRLPDGQLDIGLLLREFASFWKNHGEILASQQPYHEAAAKLVTMTYFHRIVNGGGFIDYEYGIGWKRADLLIRQPYRDAEGKRAVQRAVFELKVWHTRQPDPLAEGLSQLDAYLDRLELDTGTLIIFDSRHNAAPITERVKFEEATTPGGKLITLLRA